MWINAMFQHVSRIVSDKGVLFCNCYCLYGFLLIPLTSIKMKYMKATLISITTQTLFLFVQLWNTVLILL